MRKFLLTAGLLSLLLAFGSNMVFVVFKAPTVFGLAFFATVFYALVLVVFHVSNKLSVTQGERDMVTPRFLSFSLAVFNMLILIVNNNLPSPLAHLSFL